MITQRRLTHASPVYFDPFTVLCIYFDAKKILKGSLQPKLKGTDVWPLNARSKVARLSVSYMIIVPVM